MKNLKILFFIPFALMFSQTVSSQVKSKTFGFVLKTVLSHSVPEVSVPQAATFSKHVFLDARELEEYEVSHLPEAIYVGYKTFDKSLLKNLSKSQPIVVYCSIGKRSEQIAEGLIKDGYTNVTNLYGGIFEWVNQGRTVVDLKNKPTKNVHAYSRMWGKFLTNGIKVY